MKPLIRYASAIAVGTFAMSIGAVNSVYAQDLTQVEVMIPFPEGHSFSDLVIARANGYFAEQGIEVTSLVADGGGFVGQQLVAGNAKFGIIGAADIAVAYNRRNDVRVLFCGQVRNVYKIVARADTGITSMEGLEGKALGYTEPGGGEAKIVHAAISEAGLEVNKSIDLIPIGPAGPASLVALQNDTVQAYSSSYPDVAILAASGIEWVDITPERYSNVPGVCLVTTDEFMSTEEGLKTATALSVGWMNGLYHVLANPEESFDTICEVVDGSCENMPVAEAFFAQSYSLFTPPEGQLPGATSTSSWDTVVSILSGGGTVPADLDLSPLLSGDNLQAVTDAMYAGR